MAAPTGGVDILAWLALAAEELAVFHSVAGNRAPPTKRVRELWAIIGRRGGKSRMAAALAIYIACFLTHRLAHGERGMVLVLAASIEQAKTVFSYARAFIGASPVLSKEVDEITANEIRLNSGVIITIHSNSYKTVRGRTLLAAIFDEVAFWRDETGSQPDSETYTAVLPSLATTDGLLCAISTPYRKIGLLHTKHREYFGKDDPDVLVVQGTTKQFNPSISDAVITAQRSADPTAAMNEWDAEFRADISGYLDDATIEAAVDYGRPLELPPVSGRGYRAFCDASGGRHDHYTLGVGHRQDGRYVIDCVVGRAPPFDPGFATKELADIVKR
jgi:Terminase large subunit, ATPase domain